MIIGLRKLSGEWVPFKEVNILEWREYGVSPATLIYLCSSRDERSDVGMMTASQWGKGLRELYLERTTTTFVDPTKSVKARLGTSKHATVLTAGYDTGDVITERRMFALDGQFSGQADQIHRTKDGVYIWDTKTGKKYSLKKYRESPSTHDYTYQMNALADLWRETSDEPVLGLFIEWMPSDSGRGDLDVEIVPIEMWEPGRALAAFAGKLGRLKGYLEAETAPPFCDENERWYRWDRASKKAINMKCREFCIYSSACRKTAEFDGDIHPINMEG